MILDYWQDDWDTAKYSWGALLDGLGGVVHGGERLDEEDNNFESAGMWRLGGEDSDCRLVRQIQQVCKSSIFFDLESYALLPMFYPPSSSC